jgi:hypothetical protein
MVLALVTTLLFLDEALDHGQAVGESLPYEESAVKEKTGGQLPDPVLAEMTKFSLRMSLGMNSCWTRFGLRISAE